MTTEDIIHLICQVMVGISLGPLTIIIAQEWIISRLHADLGISPFQREEKSPNSSN